MAHCDNDPTTSVPTCPPGHTKVDNWPEFYPTISQTECDQTAGLYSVPNPSEGATVCEARTFVATDVDVVQMAVWAGFVVIAMLAALVVAQLVRR
jgi:hypothetical protein